MTKEQAAIRHQRAMWDRKQRWDWHRRNAAKWWSERAGCSDAFGQPFKEPKICSMAEPPADWEPVAMEEVDAS